MQYITPLAPAYPEMFLLAMVCVILVADLFVSDDNRVVTYVLTQLALAGCFADHLRHRERRSRSTPSAACSWTTSCRTC